MNKLMATGSKGTTTAAAEESLLPIASELTHWNTCTLCWRSSVNADVHRTARLA